MGTVGQTFPLSNSQNETLVSLTNVIRKNAEKTTKDANGYHVATQSWGKLSFLRLFYGSKMSKELYHEGTLHFVSDASTNQWLCTSENIDAILSDMANIIQLKEKLRMK